VRIGVFPRVKKSERVFLRAAYWLAHHLVTIGDIEVIMSRIFASIVMAWAAIATLIAGVVVVPLMIAILRGAI
jgi:hypothetical protein